MRRAVEQRIHKFGLKVIINKDNFHVQAVKLFPPFELVKTHQKPKNKSRTKEGERLDKEISTKVRNKRAYNSHREGGGRVKQVQILWHALL